MKNFGVKLLCLLLCVPVFPLVVFAEWYDKRTSYGTKFKFKKCAKDYWIDDVWATLISKGEGK